MRLTVSTYSISMWSFLMDLSQSVRGRPDPWLGSYMPIRVSTHLCFHQPEVSALTSVSIKYSSPWLSVKHVLSLAAVCLTKRDEEGERERGRDGGCENSRWKTSRPFLKLRSVVAGGPAAVNLTSHFCSSYRNYFSLRAFTITIAS